MSDSEKLRKHELECLRLASDCMQLACDVPDPALQSYFVRRARALQIQAEQGPDADIADGDPRNGLIQPIRGFRTAAHSAPALDVAIRNERTLSHSIHHL